MIIGTHLLLYSRDADADRAFFRDILGFSHVDAGDGWLIFALPPAEIGVHPADENLTQSHAGHNLATGTMYLLCSPLKETLDELAVKGVTHTPLQQAEWGIATSIPLPSGASLGLYEPKHALAARTGS
jgi:catechol 2,3-dioxygenase-like lactoylglutathione lyase family enzyme